MRPFSKTKRTGRGAKSRLTVYKGCKMNQHIPHIGDFVMHQTGSYYGNVVGYGERRTIHGIRATLRVGMPSSLKIDRVLIIEDLTTKWLLKSKMPVQA